MVKVLCSLLLSLGFAGLGAADPAPSVEVLFVCEHGNVKSLMAASYFNEIARARGLTMRALSRGSAPDSDTVPDAIRSQLQAEGFDVSDFHPAAVTSRDVAAAARVVTIGTSLPPSVTAKGTTIEQWNDVPAASADYGAARAVLRKRIEALLDRMTQPHMGDEPAPLTVEAKIALPGVKGRIDHLAVDVAEQRLFIAALGNGTVEVVDLKSRRRVQSVPGFDEPQGVALLPQSQTLYVASGGDGSLRTLPLRNLAPDRTLDLGDDADNVRTDRDQRFVYVGYGSGALAVIDAAKQSKVADIRLEDHPESFQLETAGPRIFVNVPDANEIAVVDREARKQIASWPTKDLHANFAMALDERNQQLLVSFRRPAMLGVFDLSNGKERMRIETCGDVDDVFVDQKRSRVYVACGEGFVDVLAEREGSYSRVGRLPTSPGARTALYSAELDRLFVAARARGAEPATLWILRN